MEFLPHVGSCAKLQDGLEKIDTVLISMVLLPQNEDSESVSCSVMSDSLWPHGLYPTSLLCPWNSPGKNTGVGSYSLLQGIFPTQESNQCLLHCRHTLYCLSHPGSPNMWQVSSKSWLKDFHGGLEVKTLCFQCRGGQGTKILHAMWRGRFFFLRLRKVLEAK